jgi:uncharacterized OsmC-like protein
MADNEKIMTELRYEGGKTVSFFENHPPIDVVGSSKVSGIPEAWSPPHLLLAAVESCFLLTALIIAEKMRLTIKSYSSIAEGTITAGDGKHYEITEIIIKPVFHLENDSDRPRLRLLAEKALQYCVVENSLKAKVKVEM